MKRCGKNIIQRLAIIILFVLPLCASGQIIPEARRTLELSGIFGDFVDCAYSPEGVVWAFGENGIVVTSADAGTTWQRVILPIIHDIRFLVPGENGHVFIGCFANRGLWYGYSTDNGKQWQDITPMLLQQEDTIISAVFTGARTLLAGSNLGRLYRLEINGSEVSSHILREVGERVTSIQHINNEYYLRTRTNIWRWNGLETDSTVPLLSPNNNRIIRAFSEAEGNITLGVSEPEEPENKEKVLVYKTANKEVVEIKVPDRSFVSTPLYIVEDGEERLYFSGVTDVLRYDMARNTIDTFSLGSEVVPTLWQFSAVRYISDSSILWVGRNNAIVVLNGSKDSLTLQSHVLSNIADPFSGGAETANPLRLYALSDSVWLAFTDIPTRSMRGGMLQRNGQHNFIYRSVDRGITYTRVAVLNGDSVETGILSMQAFVENGEIQLAGQTWGRTSYVFSSSDKGMTWKSFRIPAPFNIRPTPITSKDNSGWQYFAGIIDYFSSKGTYIYRSLDGFRQSAVLDTFIEGFGIAHLQITPNNDMLALRYVLNAADDSGQQIIRRQSGEHEWQVLRGGFPRSTPVQALWQEEDGSMWASASGAIWQSVNDGDSWEMVVQLNQFQATDKPIRSVSSSYFPGMQLFGTGLASWDELFFIRRSHQKDAWFMLRAKEQYKLSGPSQENIGDILRVGYFQGLLQGFDFFVLLRNATYLMRDTDQTTTSIADERYSNIESLPDGWLYSPAPNPATTMLRVDVRLVVGVNVSNCRLVLFDIRSGKEVLDATKLLQQQGVVGGRTTLEIPLHGIPSGAYLLQFSTEKFIKTQKVIVNN